ADMRFTMAQPEVSCHPEKLLPDARTVVSAALCYYAEEPGRPLGHGRLPRYTWSDAYVELRDKLDELGRRLGGDYRVLVDENQHVDREAAARSGVGFYGKNTLLITRRFGSWIVLGTLVTDRELETTPPLALDCGSCTLCIEPCPIVDVGLLSTDYPPGYEGWASATTGLLAVAGVGFFLLSRSENFAGAPRLIGLLGLTVDTVIVAAFVLIYQYEVGSPVNELFFVLLVEAAVR